MKNYGMWENSMRSSFVEFLILQYVMKLFQVTKSCLLQYLTKTKIFTGVPEAHDSEESQPVAAGPLASQQEHGKFGCFRKCNKTTTVNFNDWKTVKKLQLLCRSSIIRKS